jgi:hypothetical protein
MSTQYRLVQSGKTASGGCSAGQGSSEPVAPRIFISPYILQKQRGQLTGVMIIHMGMHLNYQKLGFYISGLVCF